MRALALFACLACACTQDFGQFEPNDAGAESAVDAADAADASADTGPADAPPDGIACTESGAVQLGGHCYFLDIGTQSFAAAMQGCITVGAHLVTITGSAEQATVAAIGAGMERWIGLERTAGPPTDANYQWITAEPRAGFGAWAPGEPNGSGMCVRLLANGTWADQDCSAMLASVCERE